MLCSLVLVLVLFCIKNTIFAQQEQLAAPTISVENPIEVNTSNFSLSWDALDETSFYNFELCIDASCSLKIKEIPKAGKPSVELKDIENGQYFWRVSGMDANNQSGNYSTPQPLLVALSPVQNLVDSDKQNTPEATPERSFQNIATNLPWYIYLILLAYVIFIARTLIWYFNK